MTAKKKVKKQISVRTSAKKSVMNAQQLLLTAIVHFFGGPKKIAVLTSKKVGMTIHPQSFVDWRRRGAVPMHRIGKIAKALDVPLEALNYVGISDAGASCMSWAKLVTTLKTAKILNAQDASEILKADRPVSL